MGLSGIGEYAGEGAAGVDAQAARGKVFVAQGFSADAISRRNAATGKAHIHLQEANRLVLINAGLKPENITWNGECSRCHPHKYFSARRLGINSGRTFTGILTNPT